jgi:type II secretory pathway predicted ATPase ExeA
MELHPKQREAIESCCDVSKRIVAVTGPAGTGKTTILKLAFDAATLYFARLLVRLLSASLKLLASMQ